MDASLTGELVGHVERIWRGDIVRTRCEHLAVGLLIVIINADVESLLQVTREVQAVDGVFLTLNEWHIPVELTCQGQRGHVGGEGCRLRLSRVNTLHCYLHTVGADGEIWAHVLIDCATAQASATRTFHERASTVIDEQRPSVILGEIFHLSTESTSLCAWRNVNVSGGVILQHIER